ncbi:MAG: hypothetical protein ACYC4R_02265 [Anaerolineae bacterium]
MSSQYPYPPQQQPPYQTPAPAQKSGCAGCLRGCLISVLAVVAFLLIGAGTAYAFGRPYIAKHLPAWEAEQPLLGLALDYTGLRKHLAPQVDVQAAQSGRQEGEGDRALLPEDLALVPNPVAETFNISMSQVTAFQRISATPETVQAYLLDGMAQQGWELLLERQTDAGVQYSWAKAPRNCQVEIIRREGYTEVWLRSSTIE